MNYKSTTPERRKSVYAEGKQAFDEHKDRSYNPHIKNNLALAVSWWHGWDTASEESEGSPLPKYDKMTQPGYNQPYRIRCHKSTRPSMTDRSKAARRGTASF